jgi:HAD superfamily 5'-nucleotidase-like hydrolase
MSPVDSAFTPVTIPRARGIFCNRTLNLRSIRAVGYDMDYTLIHYRTEAWERRAFEHLQRRLAAAGFPVEHLIFDPTFAIRGLILDLELGNLIKCNRFGYVKRAFHGTSPLDYEAQRTAYSRTIVDLAEPRYVFMNTFFSLSEACMYAELVDLLDEHKLPVARALAEAEPGVKPFPAVMGYSDLYRWVKTALDAAHMEGTLKAEITADPERFIDADPEMPLALLDQKRAGKKLLLITNSEWVYSNDVMSYAVDSFLPDGMKWRDLFDVIIVSARKPEFFGSRAPLFEVVSDDGLLRPALSLVSGGAFLGGNAALVERHLGLSGDEILYVGDHIYGDVHVSKSILRWRTGLIVREIEAEIAAEEGSLEAQEQLAALMVRKEHLEQQSWALRLAVQRIKGGYGPQLDAPEAEITERMNELRAEIAVLDAAISPLARAAGEIENQRWGLLMRAGNDKSHLARQVERSADIYTSRVSNFLLHTPFAYLRPPRGTLPHDVLSAPPGPGVPEGGGV